MVAMPALVGQASEHGRNMLSARGCTSFRISHVTDPVTIKRLSGLTLVFSGVLLGSTSLADAGHEVTHIPSYYPQEITIESVGPATAATELTKNTMQAYIGSPPRFAGPVPKNVKAVESLDSFLVLSFNPASKVSKQNDKRCTVARGIVAALAGDSSADVVLAPYPITPFHPDYLQHLDRIEQAKAMIVPQGAIKQALTFRARGEHALALVRSRWRVDEKGWDVSLQEVSATRLMSTQLDGWLGPPWMKQGWFQAYRLLAPALSNPADKTAAESAYRQLVNGQYDDLTQEYSLERRLLADLMHGCDRVVVGYTVRREYYNNEYSGVENVGVDSQLGLNSPIFIRTAKLKDFPWNGWLRLGMNDEPRAAWNPIGGFTDAAGRLIWSTLGDPALLPLPYNGSWIPDRVTPHVTLAWLPSGGFELPVDAVVPQPGTGMFIPVGEKKFALAKIVYEVATSRFSDGTATEVADLLYPYVIAYRWGVKSSDNDRAYDPVIETATHPMREQLVGLKVLRVERKIEKLGGEIEVRKRTPIVEVYVNLTARDLPQVAALAPPWSTVPWHVMVLMEEAVQRGLAAFSKEQSQRLGVSWLDLVRDPALQAKLSALIGEFARSGYRPPVLRELVTAEQARARWHALKQFAEAHKHLMVTNGPYRLKQWSDTSAVLQVDRDLAYPGGVGSFNHYANPPRAVVTAVKRDGRNVLIYADVEKVVQAGRHYDTVREPLKPGALRGLYAIRTDSRFVVIAPDGGVLVAGTAKMTDDGHLVAELPEHLPRGRYTFLVAIYLDGNTIRPTARMLSFEASAS